MENVMNEFQTVMNAAGLFFSGSLIADGELHRFRVAEDAKPNSWYVLYSNNITVGVFGCWKRGIKQKWCNAEYRKLGKAERLIVREHLRDANEKYKHTQERIHQEASERAEQIWRCSRLVDRNHAYLCRKKINPYNIKSYKDLLVVPLQDNTNQIWSLQFINEEGAKNFLQGGKKKGLYHLLGVNITPTIYLCEGYATACTIHEATQSSVFIAFDAFNLLPVAIQIQNKYPDKEIIVCADDDVWTPGNPGITQAKNAASAIKVKYIIPKFGH